LKGTLYKNDVQTFYGKNGDYIGFICAFLAITMALYLILRRVVFWF
jgi:hypothetical protein